MTTATRQPCAHLGRPTGRTVHCGACRGRVELRTFACAVHGECTQGRRVGDTACCVGCPDNTIITDQPQRPPTKCDCAAQLLPTSTTRVVMPHVDRDDGHGDHYNCSIIRWRGKLLMASRLGWVGSSIWLCELGDDLQPVPGTLRDLEIQHPRAYRGVEDPRLFEHRGRLCLTFSGYDRDMRHTSLFWAELDDNLRVVRTHAPEYAKRRPWEKNWGPFDYHGGLHFIYSISPHVVLRVKGDYAAEVARTSHSHAIRGQQHRGGAAPVRVGGEWYSWFHTFGSVGGVTQWALGLYTFAASPPFQLVRRVPGIILKTDPPDGSNKAIVYPCGAVLDGGRWLVSFGKHDSECWVATFDTKQVEAALK